MPSIFTRRPLTVTTRSLLWSNSAPNDWVARPALVERSGVWIATYSRDTQHVVTADARCHIRFSANQGVSWTTEDTYLDGTAVTGAPWAGHSSNFIEEPWIALAPNGDLLLHFIETATPNVVGTYQHRSTDGGKTWSDEGLLFGATIAVDHDGGVIVGSDIYITARTRPTISTINENRLYKSANNGTSWSLVSVITDTDIDQSTGEAALEWMGGTEFLAILRGTDSNADSSYLTRSYDLGATWEALEDFTVITGGLKIHRPRMRRFGSRVYLVGRDWIGDAATFLDDNIVMWTDDGGVTWSAVHRLTPSPVVDSGYVDILRRGDRSFYLLGYEGTYDAASIVQYIIEIPSHTKELDGWAYGATL